MLFTKTYTEEFTNKTITISGGSGYRNLAVANKFTSSANGTLRGTGTLNGRESSDLVIEPGDSKMITTTQELDGVIITAPLGCTLELILTTY